MWGSSEAGTRRLLRGDGTLADGSILCYLEGTDDAGTDLQHEFALVLTDDLAHRPREQGYSPQDCVEAMRQFHQRVWTTVTQVSMDLQREP